MAKRTRSKRDPDEEVEEQPTDEVEDDEVEDDEVEDEDDVEDEPEAEEEEDDEPVDFETEMHELQQELGEDWILRFSVQGDEAWLTAEKTDGSQHVEAPTAEVLLEAVELLEGGDESE